MKMFFGVLPAIIVTTKASSRKAQWVSAPSLMQKSRIPKLLSYDMLIIHIKQVDIGKVYSVEEEFASYISGDEVVHGCFRDLREYLPRLTKFYLHTKSKSNDPLKWFSETEGTFLVALGGDGCPFAKNRNPIWTLCSIRFVSMSPQNVN